MEGIRSISIAYHDRATEEEKKQVQKYFNKFDVNGDGEIRLQQYKKAVAEHLSDDRIFRKLDDKGKGFLDFNEIVCAYYMDKKLGLHKCAACKDLLVGAYFSCLICVRDGLDSDCHLCCSCYHLGEFSAHRHFLSNFVDQHTMATVLENNASRRKKEFDDLRQIATSYYLAGSEEVKDLALKFFKSMDTDGDGRVDRLEFHEFMKEEGYARMQDPEFFDELDVDGDGSLDFDEVKTAYYIYRSRRPFCDKCHKFILGIYFSCVECYRNPIKVSFNLCLGCYSSRKCDHKHDGRRAQFLDNFALLESMKLDSAKQANTTSTHQPLHQVTSPAVSSNARNRSPIIQSPSNYTQPPRSPIPAYSHTATFAAANQTINVTSNAYVAFPSPPVASHYQGAVVPPAAHRNQWRVALKALDVALAIGNIAIATTCAIM